MRKLEHIFKSKMGELRILIHNHQVLAGGLVKSQALWQDMKDKLGGMVVESDPVMALENIRKLVLSPGETELALVGRALILFQIDETKAQAGDCEMVLLSKLQPKSRDRTISPMQPR